MRNDHQPQAHYETAAMYRARRARAVCVNIQAYMATERALIAAGVDPEHHRRMWEFWRLRYRYSMGLARPLP